MYFPSVLLLLSAAVRALHSVPDDPYSFPKYRVSFLNGLPVLNDTAHHWLQHGIPGGEREFLDLPAPHDEHPKGIDYPDRDHAVEPLSPHSQQYAVELMKLGPKNSFLCLIPPPLEPSVQDQAEELQDVTPVHSWSLLQPLTGTCIYHRQAWFTYSYCHNSHVRQFREMAHVHPHPPGGYVPEEDPEWEAYTLGRAPPVPEPGAELTLAEQNALAANLDIARGAGSRYLVQRWGDGTVCDKTGKKREIEVQFHCSMTTTDHILFVKEAKTCSYVLVIQTPRLCGVPGFKSRHEAREEGYIRCREVVNSLEGTDKSLPEADFHYRRSARPKPVLPPPPRAPSAAGGKVLPPGSANDALRKALEALLGADKLKDGDMSAGVLIEQIGEDGEVVVEFIGEDELDDFGLGGDDEHAEHDHHDTLAEILRSAGFDVRGSVDDQKTPKDTAADDKSKKKRTKGKADGTDDAADPAPMPRDEL